MNMLIKFFEGKPVAIEVDGDPVDIHVLVENLELTENTAQCTIVTVRGVDHRVWQPLVKIGPHVEEVHALFQEIHNTPISSCVEETDSSLEESPEA